MKWAVLLVCSAVLAAADVAPMAPSGNDLFDLQRVDIDRDDFPEAQRRSLDLMVEAVKAGAVGDRMQIDDMMTYMDKLDRVMASVKVSSDRFSVEEKRKLLADLNGRAEELRHEVGRILLSVVEAKQAGGRSPYCRDLSRFEDKWKRGLTARERVDMDRWVHAASELTGVDGLDAFVTSCVLDPTVDIVAARSFVRPHIQEWIKTAAALRAGAYEAFFWPPRSYCVAPRVESAGIFHYITLIKTEAGTLALANVEFASP